MSLNDIVIKKILKSRKKSYNKIQSISREGNKFPLSFAQKRLWILQEVEPNNKAYNMFIPLEIKGDLKKDYFRQAIEELVRRQELLRVRIDEEDGVPYQYIMNEKIYYKYFDFSIFSDVEAETKIKNIIEWADGPFNLKKDNLCRFFLFKINNNKHIFVLIMHHIISDGQSIQILKRDLFTYYNHIKKAKALPSYNPLSLQYIDYSFWQESFRYDKRFINQYNYWVDKLKNHSYILPLPYNFERPPKLSGKGISVKFVIPCETTEKLKALCNKHNVTLFMMLHTCFNVFLKKYSGESDILIGTPISIRPEQELEDIVGFFVNTIVLRSKINDSQSFIDCLQKSKETILDAFDNQDVPIDFLLEDLMKTRDTNYSPVFQVMFGFENKENYRQEVNIEEIEVKEVNLKSIDTAKFDLSLDLTDIGEEIHGTFECSSDLFEKNTVKRFIKNLLELLKKITDNPEESIANINIVSQEEFNTLIYKWNNTEMSFPVDRCVHHLIEECVQKYPNNTAVIYQEEQLTYKELDNKANQLAHFLIEQGVAPNKTVAIGMERSLRLPIALLAVLKAGGAFVPLDLEAPIERNRQFILESGALLCLSNSNDLPIPDKIIPIITLNNDDVYNNYPTRNPNTGVSSSDLVSIYFTSGTTGKPKGVSVVHKGWVNRIIWMQNKFKLKKGETVLQKTTLTFDDVALEYFWTLMAGGRVAILEPRQHKDPYEILKAISKYSVSIVFFVPSMLKMIIERFNTLSLDFTCLREVISSGEALKPSMIEQFYTNIKRCNLHNCYGVTEVSIDSTIHTCTIEDSLTKRNVPIGRPIGNNFIYILDDSLKPVPIGVQGNLFIGGVGLARDYYNNPLKTRESFFKNPFLSSDQRIYKTGDTAYYDQTGKLYIWGRIDNQMKIRGMRIELDEIVSVLSLHPQINDCAVIAEKNERNEDPILVAYVVIKGTKTLDSKNIRNFCRNYLPAHMIPIKYFVIDEIPLNSNGKLDKNALKQDSHVQISNLYSEPRDYYEQEIRDIWVDVLESDSISINDSFFDLGGHSLKAVVLIDRLNKVFNKKISVATLFEYQTIKEIAKYIRKSEINDEIPIRLLKQRDDFKQPLILLPPGGGGLLCYYELVKQLENISVYGMLPKGYENNEEPLDDMDALAAYYFELIKKFQRKGPYKIGGWSFGGNLAYEIAKLFEESGEKIELLVVIDSASRHRETETPKKDLIDVLQMHCKLTNYPLPNVYKYEDELLNYTKYLLKNNYIGANWSLDNTLQKLRIQLANERALVNYQATGFVATDIQLIYVSEQDVVNPVPLTNPENWKNRTKSNFYSYLVPGHHENILNAQNSKNVATILNQVLRGEILN